MPRLSGIIGRMLRRAVAPKRATSPIRTRLAAEEVESRIVLTPAVSIALLQDGHEGGSDLVFRLTRTETTGGLEVSVGVSGGTALADVDYTFPTGTFFFANGKATTDVIVEVLDDDNAEPPDLAEPTETVEVTVETGMDYDVGDPDTATGNIFDNDTPIVTVGTANDAREAGAAGQFLFTRIGDLSSSLAVDYTVAGTATVEDDYDELSGTVTFAAGESTATVAVAAGHDDEYDPGETVTVTIDSGTGYDVGTEDDAEVTIDDDASNTFTLDETDGEIWYDVDWAEVDPDEATDTAPLTNVAVMFDGELFTDSNADFTVSPVAHFAYGDFIGIEFTIAFDTAVAGLESLVVADGQVAGVDATTHEAGEPVNMADKTVASLTLDFSTITIYEKSSYEIAIEVSLDGKDLPRVVVEIGAGATPEQARATVKSALEGIGLKPETFGTTGMVVKGLADDGLKKLKMDSGSTWTAPKLVGRTRASPGEYPEYERPQ